MNHLFSLLSLVLLLTSCKPIQSNKLESIQYHAQTRGYSLLIKVSPQQIITTENGKKTTLKLSTEAWETIENNINSLDFSLLKDQLNKEHIAVDRAIPAHLTITIANKTSQFELTHNATPHQLKTLMELIHVSN